MYVTFWKIIHCKKMYFIFSIYLLMFLNPSLYQANANVIEETGRCVQRKGCQGKYDSYDMCVYNGPPMSIKNKYFPDHQMTAYSILKEICPFLANDSDIKICGYAEELSDLKEDMLYLSMAGFDECASCFLNYWTLACHLLSPVQSRFLYVNKTEIYDSEELVTELVYYVSKTYADNLYNSCKDVKLKGTEKYLLNFGYCGIWRRNSCTSERFLAYIGKAGYHYVIRFIITEALSETQNGTVYYPMNGTSYRCSEPPGPSYNACSCLHCSEACYTNSTSSEDLFETSSENLFKTSSGTFSGNNKRCIMRYVNGPVFICIISFSIVALICLFLLVAYLCKRKNCCKKPHDLYKVKFTCKTEK